jgi:hypothetical protein
MRVHYAALALALAACGGSGNWTKEGADAASVGHEYQDCRSLAGTAVKTDLDIDQDIRASRGADLQRSEVVRLSQKTTHDQTRDRAGSIVDACMKAKGFTQPPK